ncbi:hypothetical protein PybrP1_006488 [[Pythium] brassicae (nom. inval.)]|nr:hypothetical protein PybrP1_006488 [[Pythium] brassicae (nom. inval.)]
MVAKGKNFSEEEEMQLCRSYLVVLKDARIRSNPKTLDQRALSFANTAHSRASGVTSRGTRSRSVTPDATRQQDIQELALHAEEKCQGFRLKATLCQWSAVVGGFAAESGADGGEIVRPLRVKAAKAAAHSAAVDVRVRKTIPNATCTLAGASAKRVRALKDPNRLALFAIKLDELDTDAQEFFRTKGAAVLEDMRAESRSLASTTVVVEDDGDISHENEG